MTNMYKDLEDLEVIKKWRIIKFKNKLFISWTIFIITTIIFILMMNYLDDITIKLNPLSTLILNILIIWFIINLFYLTIILPVESKKILYKILFFIVNYIIWFWLIILIFIISLVLWINELSFWF